LIKIFLNDKKYSKMKNAKKIFAKRGKNGAMGSAARCFFTDVTKNSW
jgi:hypothetical protein